MPLAGFQLDQNQCTGSIAVGPDHRFPWRCSNTTSRSHTPICDSSEAVTDDPPCFRSLNLAMGQSPPSGDGASKA